MANGFRYYYQTKGGAGNDVFDGNQQALSNTVGPGPNWTSAAAGITTLPVPSSGTAIAVVIEMDSAEVEIITQTVGASTEYPYIQTVVSGAQANPLSVVYVFSGLRYAYKGGQTFTT